MGHEERFPPPSLSGRCGFQKQSLVVDDWAKAGFGSGFEPFGGAVMGPDPRHEGTAGESEPGLSVFLSVKSPAKRRPHVSTLASKLIGAVAAGCGPRRQFNPQ